MTATEKLFVHLGEASVTHEFCWWLSSADCVSVFWSLPVMRVSNCFRNICSLCPDSVYTKACPSETMNSRASARSEEQHLSSPELWLKLKKSYWLTIALVDLIPITTITIWSIELHTIRTLIALSACSLKRKPSLWQNLRHNWRPA